jgi:1-acyl-sn-glycerol-3-phosphate acyltransferase
MLRLWLRSALLLALLAGGLALALVLILDWRERLPRDRIAQRWHRLLLAIFGIRIRTSGRPCVEPHVTVANHVSWLDIPVIGALQPTRFVSKSEVRYWPVAGQFATASGTFFIRRGKGGTRPLLRRLVPHLRAGGAVTFFPEGTTTGGRSLRPFHPRLFAAATDTGCRVQPVALRYGVAPNGDDIAPFIDDDELVSHILRLLKAPGLVVEVTYCPTVSAIDHDRDELALAAEQAIRRVIEGPGAARANPARAPDGLPARLAA